MTETASSSKKPLLIGGGLIALGAIVVMFVLPAETGYDPTGIGEMTGLTKIAEPDNEELERGMARMETQEVLVLSETALEPIEGAVDEWSYELDPFQAIEFKYTIAEGQPIAFHWEGTGELHYDMHAHPFDGGEELTESYGLSELTQMDGTYTPAFTGIHGWYWQNRSSSETVTVTLKASGAMTSSTIFLEGAATQRPIEGVEVELEGTVAGHQMQSENSEAESQ